jgi:hypothetical protein
VHKKEQTKPTSQSPSIDVKAMEGVSGCCLTTAKCQNDTSVTKMGKPSLYKDIFEYGDPTWLELY